jgi:hypothetical protein
MRVNKVGNYLFPDLILLLNCLHTIYSLGKHNVNTYDGQNSLAVLDELLR